MALTRCGPGKFDLVVDQIAYDSFMDEECGSVFTTNWYGLTKGDFEPRESEIEDLGLSAEDIRYLKSKKAAIIEEDSQGFVDVYWYTSVSAANKDWKRTKDAVYEAESDEEGY